jgi:F-type H+-transporting ATPase subunit alpha
MPVEEQVVAIFAGVRGYLDAIEVGDVGRFETALLSEVRAKAGDILDAIRVEGELSDDTEAKLKELLDGFAKSFVA